MIFDPFTVSVSNGNIVPQKVAKAMPTSRRLLSRKQERKVKL